MEILERVHHPLFKEDAELTSLKLARCHVEVLYRSDEDTRQCLRGGGSVLRDHKGDDGGSRIDLNGDSPSELAKHAVHVDSRTVCTTPEKSTNRERLSWSDHNDAVQHA